jgi:hypothetical protein
MTTFSTLQLTRRHRHPPQRLRWARWCTGPVALWARRKPALPSGRACTAPPATPG